MKKKQDYIPPESEAVSVSSDINFMTSSVSMDGGVTIENILPDGLEFIW